MAAENKAKLSEFFAKKTKGGRKGFKPVKLNLAAEVVAKPLDPDAEDEMDEGDEVGGFDRRPKRKELFSSDGWVDEDADLAPVAHTGGRQVQALSTLNAEDADEAVVEGQGETVREVGWKNTDEEQRRKGPNPLEFPTLAAAKELGNATDVGERDGFTRVSSGRERGPGMGAGDRGGMDRGGDRDRGGMEYRGGDRGGGDRSYGGGDRGGDRGYGGGDRGGDRGYGGGDRGGDRGHGGGDRGGDRGYGGGDRGGMMSRGMDRGGRADSEWTDRAPRTGLYRPPTSNPFAMLGDERS